MDKKHFETLNVCSLFLLILFLITGRKPLLYIALGLLGVSIFIKPLGKLIANAWLRFSFLIGTVNSRILLTLFFYILLTPLAVIRRLFGHDLLLLEKPGKDSCWKTVDKEFDKTNLEKTW